MLTAYRSNTYIPNLVERSKQLAKKYEFNHSCSDETGRLLAVLAGQVKEGKILEVGTGLGVGSAWILSNISSSVKFISVDNCEEKVALTSEAIEHEQAEFIYGDWKEVIKEGPFQFIFADAAAVKLAEASELYDILDIGGTLLMDDFTPEEHWPDEWKGKPDEVRGFWLNHEGLMATEVYLTPMSSAIIAVRVWG
jgi:predicted O-methyltransferase YrrM